MVSLDGSCISRICSCWCQCAWCVSILLRIFARSDKPAIFKTQWGPTIKELVLFENNGALYLKWTTVDPFKTQMLEDKLFDKLHICTINECSEYVRRNSVKFLQQYFITTERPSANMKSSRVKENREGNHFELLLKYYI